MIHAEIAKHDDRWFLVMSRTIPGHGDVKALTDITDIYQDAADSLRALWTVATEEAEKATEEAAKRAHQAQQSPVQFYFKMAVSMMSAGKLDLAQKFLDKMYNEIVCTSANTEAIFEYFRAHDSACKKLAELKSAATRNN